ncbi:MAG: endonuclease domain-containing protein [Polaromonas sp.]|nr:endonuclease domain-containing protein [Polaromonas sp.]
MSVAGTLTPALFRKREREPEGSQLADGPQPQPQPFFEPQEAAGLRIESSLSRVRERAGVRVRARSLRLASTDAESLLWSRLRARQLNHLKFRRQYAIGPYFADFACIEIGLVIEVDGGQHAEAGASVHDRQRSTLMNAQGFTTLRFWNNDVLTETTAVLEKILHVAKTLTPALSRKREREQDKDFKGNSP